MTFKTPPSWSAERENELEALARDTCALAKKNKHTYDTLLETSKKAKTYEEKKHIVKLLTVALHFWVEQMEKCRAGRKAYIEYRQLK